jgi:hypothetical protein
MSDQVKRARSPNYPAISLPVALQQLRSLFDRIQKHKAPKEAIIKGLGYGGWNGASATALSAHTKYGILERLDKDEFKISELGMRLLFHKNPAEYAEALYEAATKPPLFAEFLIEYQNTVPHEDIMRPRLIRQGFAQSAVATVIECYRETMKFVSDNSVGYTPKDNDVAEETMQTQQPPTANALAHILSKGPQETYAAPYKEVLSGREERILDDDGNAIVVKFPVEPTVETYEFLKEYLEFRIQRLSRTAKKVMENGDD